MIEFAVRYRWGIIDGSEMAWDVKYLSKMAKNTPLLAAVGSFIVAKK